GALVGPLLLTQKALFAAPGLGLALLIRRRTTSLTLFAIGVSLPIAATAWWFYTRGAFGRFWYYTVTFNGTLNADRFSPFPRLASNIIQQPAIYVLGAIGITIRLKPDTTPTTVRPGPDTGSRPPGSIGDTTAASGLSRTVITSTALSLIAGIFIIGKAYDQYYTLLLPLLAVLGGAVAAASLDATRHGPSIAGAAMVILAAVSLAISARRFTPIEPQLDEIAFVTAQTRPSDTYVGGSPGAALFPPRAWYSFSLPGPLPPEADYPTLLAAPDAARARPRLIARVLSPANRAPPALLGYIAAHYQQARGDVYLRQSEYGSVSL